jgi:quercetin dioxygenase-like cupin family protein
MLIQSKIDQLDSMYPSMSFMLTQNLGFVLPEAARWGSIYGYSFANSTVRIDQQVYQLQAGQYFSFFAGAHCPEISCEGLIFVVLRLGYKCQNTTGWIETQGRLSYINGCSDSLLIYPPRQGDPSLNLLYFPPGIEQTQHLHPSIRMGCVIAGHGISDVWNNGCEQAQLLRSGMNFCLEQNELHRFRTTDSSMTVIAWHPDGDWGPTDHDHTMLNRTYIKK